MIKSLFVLFFIDSHNFPIMKALRKSIKYLTNIEAMKMVNNFQNKDFELLLKYSDKDYQNLEEKKSKLKEYELYEFEIIQLFNFTPKQILHLQLVIEEMEERFDEEKLEKILQIFK